jgi:hypothetical protein
VCPPHGPPGGFSAQLQCRPSGKGGRGLQAEWASVSKQSACGQQLLLLMMPQHHVTYCLWHSTWLQAAATTGHCAGS